LEFIDLTRPGLEFVSGNRVLEPYVSEKLLYWERSHFHWPPYSREVAGKALASLIIDEGLHEGRELKRSLGFGISDDGIDAWYSQARRVGTQGGKLLGAGGGGFVLLLAPPERHEAIRAALGHPRELEFEVDRLGSRIIFISG